MAGLLDIFGTSGGDTMGLLGMSPEDVQKNRDSAQAQALYALAGRLFQGGRGGASIVEGLQQGQQAYRQAMQGSLQQQLQNAQIQDMLRKRQQEQLALAEQKRIQQVLGQGVTPEVQARPSQEIVEDGRFIGDSAAVQARPAGFDIGRIAPQLMASPEGRKALTELISTQKAMGGEIFKLGEGEKQYQRNPLTGEVTEVATGAPRRRDTVTVGNVVLDKNTMEVLYTAPDAPAGSIKEFQDFSKLTPREQAAYLQLQEQKRPVTNVNVSTEGERKASLFQEQMKAASGTIASLGPVDMSNLTNQAAFKGAGGLGNIVVDPKIQQYKQAADQWSESYLRVKTGAAATPAEVELNNRTFFPALGDNAETVKLKERMRKKAEQDLGIMAGRAEVKGSKTTTEEPVNLGVSIPAGVTVKRKPS
jgi:hypothetical protein